MKTTLLAFFFLAFPFAFSTALEQSIATLDVEPLLDKNGKPVVNGDLYVFEPVAKGNGGGLEIWATGEETCPISVRQSPSDRFSRESLFIIVNSTRKGDYVYPTDSMDIIFAGKPVSAKSPKWIVKSMFPVSAVFIGRDEYKLFIY